MSKTYEAVRDYVVRPDNFNVLENTYLQYFSEFQQLKNSKGIDFGQSLNWENFKSIPGQVQPKVRTLLGVDDIPNPGYMIFDRNQNLRTVGIVAGGSFFLGTTFFEANFLDSVGLSALLGVGIYLASLREVGLSTDYNHQDQTVRLATKTTVTTAGSLAHEYDHHIQSQIGGGEKIEPNHPLYEGRAIGTERVVCRELAYETGNPAYMYDALKMTVEKLTGGYLLACSANDKEPQKDVLTSRLARKLNSVGDVFFGINSQAYELGVSAICIGEARKGMVLYSDTLKGDFSFLSS